MIEPMSTSEKQLLLQTFNSSDENDYYFSITLTANDLDVLLRRIRLFQKHRILDPHLDEMVFDGGLGGYFFHKKAYSMLELLPPPDVVADQVVVCGFEEGGDRSVSPWQVSTDGKIRHAADPRFSAVQWRGLGLDGLTIYSGPVWEYELEDIRGRLSPNS